MKEMPTQELPADSEYIYIPETDEWKVQKKSGNKKLSKKDYGEEAICPSCGEWKTTDFTPEELQEKEWECSECMNKRLVSPQELPENRGSKPITKFSPEFDWLLKLVNVIAKAAPEAMPEIKTLSQSHPFKTIDDAGDLAAQIWTLATEKYGIPREWLIKKLPERRASLKQAYEGGWPTEEDSVSWGAAAPNTYSDEATINHDYPMGVRQGDTGEPIVICPKCKSDKINIESSPAKCEECGTDFVPQPDRGSDDPTVNDYSQNYFWGPNDLGRSHQNQPGAGGWLPAGTEDMDGPSPNVRMSSFSGFMHKQSSLNKVAHCGPCSVLKMEALHILIDLYYKDNDLFPEDIIEELSIAATELKVDNFNDILESVVTEYLEEASEEVGDKLPKLKNLLIALKDIAPKLGKEIEVVDKQENVDKEADLRQYSNEPTKEMNDWIVAHPDWMHRVIEQSKESLDELEFEFRLKALLSGVANEWGIAQPILWNELAYAWFHTLNREGPKEKNFDIENLPTLDKSKKLDELLDQLSAETDPQKKEQIKQHIERIKRASLNKQANPPSRFWIAPDGKEFPVAGVHGSWIQLNKDILKQYGIPFTHRDLVWRKMVDNGWTRVSNEPAGTGFQIEVNDIHSLPNYLDNFVAKNFKKGDVILVADPSESTYIDNPFPTIQKAVNKELRKPVLSSKQASLDEVLDQTTQDAIAAEYGVQYLIPLRFYSEARSYGQEPQRAFAYAMEEGKREKQEIDPKQLAELVETYF